ncbi:FHA domain-containing protein [Sinorhizobium fredii]|uniref:FHA domain-containing protein n=1 Tax=Rhizobium fredii TaxID=380 RepID=UPI0035162AE6
MIVLTIGRKTDCNIVLSAETVSRKHAELHVLGEGKFFIQDTASSAGTFVRDGSGWRRVRRAVVESMDILKFGDLQISVEELLSKAGPQAKASDVVETRPSLPPGSRFERDPETGLIREKR